MKTFTLFLVLAISGLCLSNSSAQTGCVGVPDLDQCQVWQDYEGQATLLVIPDGSGNPLSAARTPDGIEVDATIHLLVEVSDYCEAGGGPVANFPREDLWLESVNGGVVSCLGGMIADVDTDINGETQWSQPFNAGGWDEGETWVMASGSAVGGGPLSLNFNSPDLNGDGQVNLSDLAEFSQDYYAGFVFRSDFMRDGNINLSDVAVMAYSMGKGCP